MDDNDIQYAVKLYQKMVKAGNHSYADFVQDVRAHILRSPPPRNTFDPFSFAAQAERLWDFLELPMRDLVAHSEPTMAKFARRYCIPYRTLQAWCDGTNPCPVYIKMMLGEILKMYTRVIRFDMNGGRL